MSPSTVLSYSETQSTTEDSLFTSPDKMKAKSTGETIAYYVPLGIVYLPVKLSFMGLASGFGWVSDNKIVEKVDDFLNSDDGLRGVLPTFSAQTGYGIKFYQKALLSSPNAATKDNLWLTGAFGDDHRALAEIVWDSLSVSKHDYFFRFVGKYQHNAEEMYHGLGPHSSADDKFLFNKEFYYTSIELNGYLTKQFRYYFRSSYENNMVHDGDIEHIGKEFPISVLNESSAPGIKDDVDLFSVTGGISVNAKNRQGNPYDGYESYIDAGFYQGIIDEDWRFMKFNVDYTKYFHIIYKRVIAFRVASEMNRTLGENDKIPFFYHAELGDQTSIRGYSRFRFLGHDKLLSSLEYRYPLRDIWDESGLDFTFFMDVGQVSQKEYFVDSRFTDLKVGIGAGIRIWSLSGLTAKLEVAKSSEMWRVYFILN